MSSLLKVENLSFAYQPGHFLIRQLNWQVQAGDFWGISGASGCGKSTLCKCLCGIIPHGEQGLLEGNIFLQQQNTATWGLGEIAAVVGMVFQNAENQFFSNILEDNLAFAPENLCLPRAEIAARIQWALEVTGLTDYRYCSPYQLSGGQQQLAALGCVLTLNPQVLIFDEVMSQLDEDGCRRVLAVIAYLRQQGKAVIMVDHQKAHLDSVNGLLVFGQQGVEVLHYD